MTSERKPLIGISACLLGQNVRYDGGNKFDELINSELAGQFDWLPICPETAIGMGVPRPKIQLVQTPCCIRVKGVDDKSLDVSSDIDAYALRMTIEHTRLCGFIGKSRSPSCGIGDTPLFDPRDAQIGVMNGYFMETLTQCRPDLPIISEAELRDPAKKLAFIEAVNALREQEECADRLE